MVDCSRQRFISVLQLSIGEGLCYVDAILQGTEGSIAITLLLMQVFSGKRRKYHHCMENFTIYLLSFGSKDLWSASCGGFVYSLGTPILQMGSRRQHTKANPKALGQRRYLLWTLLAVSVLAIVVPVTVMFSKKKKSAPPKSSILIPLYVYPAPGAWDPLFAAITNYPSLNFTVVVNPASGPGMGAGPDGNYTREIPKLNAYGNVQTVGYVSTDYTKRNLSLVLQDIGTYSAWSQNITAPGLGMNGIFLDETPSQYDEASAEYYETIESAVRSSDGLGINPLIIQNPGTLPDARFLSKSMAPARTYPRSKPNPNAAGRS